MMSDFDEVLERLVTDPAFRAALQADPEAALRDYRLDPQERALLASQLDADAGADRAVEERISKSGVFGLVGPVVASFGAGAPPPQGTQVFGIGARDEPRGVASFGQLTPGGQQVMGTMGGGPSPVAPAPGTPAAETPPLKVPTGPAPAGYTTWVDADGDGRGDAYRAVDRGAGGVDIYVDQDGDGVVDFVGHDYDRDGLIDTADYDTDGDGRFDTRMTDINGDGWLDQSAPYPTQPRASFGYTGEGHG
jgi:hypothetical protein